MTCGPAYHRIPPPEGALQLFWPAPRGIRCGMLTNRRAHCSPQDYGSRRPPIGAASEARSSQLAVPHVVHRNLAVFQVPLSGRNSILPVRALELVLAQRVDTPQNGPGGPARLIASTIASTRVVRVGNSADSRARTFACTSLRILPRCHLLGARAATDQSAPEASPLDRDEVLIATPRRPISGALMPAPSSDAQSAPPRCPFPRQHHQSGFIERILVSDRVEIGDWCGELAIDHFDALFLATPPNTSGHP